MSTNVFNDDLNPHIFIYPALIITEFYMTLLDTIDGLNKQRHIDFLYDVTADVTNV